MIDTSALDANIINTGGQRTAQWFAARKNVITASHFDKVLSCDQRSLPTA